MEVTTSNNRTHYPALDGLRGLAILLVVFYHNFNFIPFFNYGWLGVDLFFVLSGFLITNILLNSIDTGSYFKNFYSRRILRIFPLYYASLLLFIIILPSFFSISNIEYYQKHQIWFWSYLQNWLLVFHSDSQARLLNHFWSLAVEEQFYLLCPFFILLLRKPKNVLLFSFITLLLVIAGRLYIWTNKEQFQSFDRLFLFTRIDGILIGTMLAAVYNINKQKLRKYNTIFILLLAGINFIIYFIPKSADFPIWSIAGFTMFSAIFALLVYELITKENKIIQSIFISPLLQFFGKYSYGFYIFHWPIFLLFKPYTDTLAADWFSGSHPAQLIFSASLATMAGLFISVVSYHLFEKHFLKLKKYFA